MSDIDSVSGTWRCLFSGTGGLSRHRRLCPSAACRTPVAPELFNAFPSISGVFDTPEEDFDHSKHKIRINLHPGLALRSAVSQIKPKHVAAVVSETVLTSVTDLKPGSVNVKLSGAKLEAEFSRRSERCGTLLRTCGWWRRGKSRSLRHCGK
ncbi:MAG: hypothetical protein LBC46_06300 [Treponema sp.]|nr:hypothetical protein [Treponema sp.]